MALTLFLYGVKYITPPVGSPGGLWDKANYLTRYSLIADFAIGFLFLHVGLLTQIGIIPPLKPWLGLIGGIGHGEFWVSILLTGTTTSTLHKGRNFITPYLESLIATIKTFWEKKVKPLFPPLPCTQKA